MSALSSAQEDAWASVFGPLYKAVDVSCPGSLNEQVAERALDYAINAFAADPPGGNRLAAYAVHDHFRNARHNAVRAAQRDTLGMRRLMAASTGTGATRVLGPIEHRSPEDHAVADDFLRRLRAKLGRNVRAAAVLEGMLQELPPALISSANNVPLRTVERLRASIRATATQLAAA
jgi:hypothetical protein